MLIIRLIPLAACLAMSRSQRGSRGWQPFPEDGPEPGVSGRRKYYRFGQFRDRTSTVQPDAKSFIEQGVNNVTPPPPKPRKFSVPRRARNSPRNTRSKATPQCGKPRKFVLKLMKQEGMYDEKYMAEEIYEAARSFPDLRNEEMEEVTEDYTCDSEECKELTDTVRKEFLFFGAARPKAGNLTNVVIAKHERRNSVAEIWRRPARISVMTDTERFAGRSFRARRFGPARRRRERRQAGWRRQRTPPGLDELIGSVESDLDTWNGLDGSAGTTILIESTDEHGDLRMTQTEGQYEENPPNTGLLNLCETKRGLRFLGDSYVPKILNEVVCTKSNCLGDAKRNRRRKEKIYHGTCAQRFLRLYVYKNIGTEQCPRWAKVHMRVRVCCDCRVKKDSGLFNNFLKPRSSPPTWG